MTERKADVESFKKFLSNSLMSGELSGRYFNNKAMFKPAELSADLQKLYHIITLKDNDDIFIYNEKTGLYENNGDKTLKEKVKAILGDGYLMRRANAVIDDIIASTYMNRDDFDASIQFIPVENGVLDISQNPVVLLHHGEEYFFTNTLPVTYAPEAECPKFLKFLSEILPDEKFRLQIQEMFGWCLWRDYHQQVAFMLIGEGSNGRSTLLGVLRALLGDKNVSSQSLQVLCENRFSKAELYRKFANIAPDIPSEKITDSSVFKELTGGDLINGEKKFRDPFSFVNHAKLIFSANKLPYSKDKTYAYYRRWMLIFFDVLFGDDGKPVDKKILEKITTPEELSGILNWAIAGLTRLNDKGEFSERLSVDETQDYYERLVSPVYRFLIDCVAEADNEKAFVPKDYIYEKLQMYCKNKRLPKPKTASKKQIAYYMNKYFKNIKSAQRKVGSIERVHVWLNCQFIDPVMKLDYATVLGSSG